MAPIIQTCSALVLLVVPSIAAARPVEPSTLALYARARVADALKLPDRAVPAWRAILNEEPDVLTIAYRAWRAGVSNGDFPLAIRAAQSLERSGTLPPDAALMLALAALRDGDGVQASTRLVSLQSDDGFGFLARIISGWLGDEDPVTAKPDAYQAEARALHLAARGDAARTTTAITALWATDLYRSRSLRIAAAATLAKRDRRAALALLTASDRSSVAARGLIDEGRSPAFAVDTPSRIAAFVLARMAGDLIVQRAPRSAVSLARMATFADPANARYRLIAAGALSAAKRDEAALALIADDGSDPVYGEDAASLRIDLLEATGQGDAALAAARGLADRSTNDQTRVGDIEARRGNFSEAAQAYRAVLARVGEQVAPAQLWLAIGNAEQMAGNWSAARPALERAVALAPDNARALNQLAFGLAERREALPRARTLVERAAQLQPDNAAITDSLGYIDLKLGRTSSAIALLERARFLDPAEPDIGEHLGDAYWTAGRRVEARYMWRAALAASDGKRERLAAKLANGLR